MPLTILYEEGTKARSTNNSVYVQLRKWGIGEGDPWDAVGDVVLETYVKIEDTPPAGNYTRFDPCGYTDAELIRAAIRRYDDMITEHPILGKPDGDQKEPFDPKAALF